MVAASTPALSSEGVPSTAHKPAETAEALRGGWLHTGDLARVDADGYLTLVDRLKDMIITGGHNVYSVEVEGALAAHPDIADVAVVGRPHPDYGESIVAVITPRDGAMITLDDVRAFLRDRLTGYKIPHHVITGAIPPNASRRYSGCPRATQRPGGRHAPAAREAEESPHAADLPGAAELMGAPCRGGMGVKLPGPLRGDGFGDHRVHDILLACGPPCSGAAIEILLEGYDSPAASNRRSPADG